VGTTTTGHTLFYAATRFPAAGDTGKRHSDSARRAASGTASGTVRSHASGEVAVTASSATGVKRTTPASYAVVHHKRAWTVQVASYETLDEAQAMQQILCGRGYAARVLGAVRPYDVRVGHYPTSDSALAVARHLRSRQLTVFVTPAE
jgi:cell division protein FtsN